MRRTVADLEAVNAELKAANAELVQSAAELVARHDAQALEQPDSDRLRDQVSTLRENLARRTSESDALQRSLAARDTENASLRDKLAEQQSEAAVLRDKLAARPEDASWAAQTASLRRDVQWERDAYIALRAELDEEKASASALRAELDEEKASASALRAELDEKASASTHQDLQRQVVSLTDRLEHERKQRQQYYERWASLRGTMRGVVRVRPLDDGRGMATGWSIDKYGQSLSVPQAASIGNAKTTYTFDRVFGPATSAGQLFSEITPLVSAALHGEQVLIFAYGASGTGKSFSINQILQATTDMIFQSETPIKVSYLSIYLDIVYDLIAPKAGHALKFTHPLRALIPDNATVESTDTGSFWRVFQRGDKRRRKAATNLNTQSSRDHGVLTLLLGEGGSLTVCDLAGTENVRDSGVAGEALQQAISINKSLNALRDVISSLRTSKPSFTNPLTQLLRPALGGGDSEALKTVKVLMLGTVSSEMLASSRETLKWVGEACGKTGITGNKAPAKPGR